MNQKRESPHFITLELHRSLQLRKECVLRSSNNNSIEILTLIWLTCSHLSNRATKLHYFYEMGNYSIPFRTRF